MALIAQTGSPEFKSRFPCKKVSHAVQASICNPSRPPYGEGREARNLKAREPEHTEAKQRGWFLTY